MFNLKKYKIVKELKNINQQMNWLQFSFTRKNNNELFNSIINENKFIEEDLKIRAMVENMLKKEFSNEIKNIKNYDFLVDSVVNRIKLNQMKDISSTEELE